MAENIDIIINGIDNATKGIQSVTKSIGGLDQGLLSTIESMTGLNVASLSIAGGIGLVGTAVKKAIDDTLVYTQSVKDLSQLTGEGAENTSRLIQVSNELSISQKDLTSAMEAANKKGISTSIAGLMTLSDKYLFLQTTVEKNQFLLENFGASGLEMADMMEIGAAGILEMSNAVDKNKVLTEENIKAADDYKKALKDLTVELDGLTYALGNGVLPYLVDFLRIGKDVNQTVKEQKLEWMNFLPVLGGVRNAYLWITGAMKEQAPVTDTAATAIFDYTDNTKAQEQAVKDAAEAQKLLVAQIKATSEANTGLLGTITSVKKENDKFDESMGNLITKGNDLQGELNTLLSQGWSPYSEKVQEVTGKLNDNKQAMTDLQVEHDRALSLMVWNLYVAKLQADGFTDAEFNMALQAGITAGVLDQKSVDMARAMNDTATAAAGAKQETINFKSAIDNLADKAVTITTHYVNTYGSSYNDYQNQMGYANGANFIVPPGYPNDSYPMRVQSGEHVTVTPAGKSSPTGSGVTLVYSPMVSLATLSEAENVLLPMLRKLQRAM